MAIHDEDRGAKAKKRAAKVAVRRKPKAPPLPVPSMPATLLIPHQTLPKPRPARAPRSVVMNKTPKDREDRAAQAKAAAAPKPAPHGGHVPTQFQYESAIDLAFPAAPGSRRDKQIRAYNQ
ncbi:MAG TPA: hypothetical protein VFH51_03295, partial [Myxococcota bacterium]|nr:hypothetical protein [Myxococcota bacterium]